MSSEPLSPGGEGAPPPGGSPPTPPPPTGPPPSPPPLRGSLWRWGALIGGAAGAALVALWLSPGAVVVGEAPLSFPLEGIHWHAAIEVRVHGHPVDLGPVPPGAVLVGQPWLHHHGDNTAHIESFNFPGGAFTRPGQISLGAFFDAIGVLLTREQVCFPDGTGCANGKRFKVEVFVNGGRKADFLNYTLRDRDVVEIRAE
ncbi:MAG: hypothetical protein QXT68_06910 [Halobacteria archaeon]